MIYLKLFLTFLEIGLLSFGGGYAAVPLLESAVVEGNGWLTQAAFSDLVSIAEMTPGPIGINAATFVGVRVAGIGGAVCASLGFIVPSVVIVSLLFFLYAKYRTLPFLQRVLKSLRPVVVALIASAGLTILKTVALNGEALSFSSVDWVALGLFLAALGVLRTLKWNPILIMAICGTLYLCVGALTGL